MRAMAIHLAESDGNNALTLVRLIIYRFISLNELNNTEHIDPRGPTPVLAVTLMVPWHRCPLSNWHQEEMDLALSRQIRAMLNCERFLPFLLILSLFLSFAILLIEEAGRGS